MYFDSEFALYAGSFLGVCVSRLPPSCCDFASSSFASCLWIFILFVCQMEFCACIWERESVFVAPFVRFEVELL